MGDLGAGAPLVTAGPQEGSREWFAQMTERRHPGVAGLARTFAWVHLPSDLQAVSAPCGRLAARMIRALPDGPELSAGLRKLREAKDCFVLAAVEAKEYTVI